MNVLNRILIIIFVLTSSTCAKPAEAAVRRKFIDYKGKYIISISKKNFVLKVYDKNMTILESYKIGFGSNPDREPKLHSGDNRTPEGKYYITQILSMDAEKDTSAYQNLRDMNKVFFNASEGHSRYNKPNEDLGCNAYGPRFFRINYPNAIDKKRYNDSLKNRIKKKKNGKFPGIGGGIAIHGNADPDSIGSLSSSGCIRMYNDDIVTLEKYVSIDTPVFIY